MSCRGFPGGASSKETTCQCRRCKRCRFDPWVGKIPRSRNWQPNPVFLPGKSLEQRSMVDYRLLSLKESDTTEQLSTKFPAFSYASVISHYSYGLGLFVFFFLIILLGIPWLSSGQYSPWARVQSLVWELRSCKPHNMAKKIKKKSVFYFCIVSVGSHRIVFLSEYQHLNIQAWELYFIHKGVTSLIFTFTIVLSTKAIYITHGLIFTLYTHRRFGKSFTDD